MLQRIQSLYLLVIAILNLSMLGMSLATAGSLDFNPFGIVDGDDMVVNPIGVLILIIISGIDALIAIFWYKKRKQQMLMCKSLMFMQALLLAAVFFYFDAAINETQVEVEAHYGVGTFFPIISLILAFMADKAIKKDDDLVRSVDRIR